MSPSRTRGEERSPANGRFPFPTAEHHDTTPALGVPAIAEPPTEDALDHGIEESFPASDPVSVSVTLPTLEPDNTDTVHKKKCDHR